MKVMFEPFHSIRPHAIHSWFLQKYIVIYSVECLLQVQEDHSSNFAHVHIQVDIIS